MLRRARRRDAVCCGFSMGGYILFEFLRRYPQLVRALILCDTKAEADTPEGQHTRDEHAALVEREGLGALAELLLPKLLGRDQSHRQPDADGSRARHGAAPADRGGGWGAARDAGPARFDVSC